MNSVRSWRAQLLAIGILVCFSAAFAQSDLGSISGFVKDPSGAVVPKAQVTVKSEATGTERRTSTNEAGYYTVTNIPAGLYTVSAEAPGFKKIDSLHNKLDPSGALAVDVALTVGAATEVIEVSASAQVLQTETASVQAQVTREQIDMLELNGRNPIGLAALAPGARGGTNAILVRGARRFAFHLGPHSFRRHREHAESLGLGCRTYDSPALHADIDLPSDLDWLEREQPGLWEQVNAVTVQAQL